jgi:hypothetical protein
MIHEAILGRAPSPPSTVNCADFARVGWHRRRALAPNLHIPLAVQDLKEWRTAAQLIRYVVVNVIALFLVWWMLGFVRFVAFLKPDSP